LDEAKRIVCEERHNIHGLPEKSFKDISYLWEDYLTEKNGNGSVSIKPHDVGVLMILLKIARIKGNDGTNTDDWIDIAGYAACGRETQTAQ